MKKILIFMLCAALAFSFSACGKRSEKSTGADTDIFKEEVNYEPTQTPTEAPPVIEDDSTVDLTNVSNMIAYAELFSMAMSPEEYVGKTVKLTGVYSSFFDENLNYTYRACTVSDNTSCCAQGIYFELGETADPSRLPENGEEVTIEGEFQLYTMADGYGSYHLVNTVII